MSNETSNDTIIGGAFIAMGIFGFLENALTAYIMATDSQMKNPTYFYMINLCVADGFMLVPLMIYTGVILLRPSCAAYAPWTVRLASFLVDTIWNAGCPILILTSITRYVQLKKSHKVHVYFTRKSMITSVIVTWLVSALIFSPILYVSESPVFTFYPNLYTWEYDRDSRWGTGYFIGNQLVNVCTTILINVFNILSLMCIHCRRRQVQTDVDTSANFKREIKLFVQCAITGCIFTTAIVLFFVMSLVSKDEKLWYVCLSLQLLWAMHHAQNPIIYFVFNARLRKRFFDMLRKKKSNMGHLATAPAGQQIER